MVQKHLEVSAVLLYKLIALITKVEGAACIINIVVAAA